MLPLGIRAYLLKYLSSSQIFPQCARYESRSCEINITFFFLVSVPHSASFSDDLKWFLFYSL